MRDTRIILGHDDRVGRAGRGGGRGRWGARSAMDEQASSGLTHSPHVRGCIDNTAVHVWSYRSCLVQWREVGGTDGASKLIGVTF